MSTIVLDRPVTDQASIPTVQDVLAALEVLGDTPGTIAHSLAQRGVTGRKNVAFACPIANYLDEQFDSLQFSAYLGVWGYTPDRSLLVHTRTPAPVFEFMEAFDEGFYPELVA